MEEVRDTYRSVGTAAEGLYKDNGSRFLAFAYPVETVDEVRQLVDALKKKYHDARHHCFAYRLGMNGETYRVNDDGEPSSSAGRPILGQIDSMGLSDVLVVVVRYFGGVKLGIPGLIKAYRTSSQEALANAGTVEKTASRVYAVSFDYLSMNSVMKVVKDLDLPQLGQDFGANCTLTVRVRLCREQAFVEQMSKIDNCRCETV